MWPNLELEGPGTSGLSGQAPIEFRDCVRVQKELILIRFVLFSDLRCVYYSIDYDVGDMDTLWSVFSGQGVGHSPNAEFGTAECQSPRPPSNSRGRPGEE